MLEDKIRDARHDLVNRIQQFVNHLQRSSHFAVEAHNNNLDDIEQVTLARKDEGLNPQLKWLSFQPKFLSSTTMPGPEWKQKYDRHCQFVFSYCQHHGHSVDEKGNRVPLKYCSFLELLGLENHTRNLQKSIQIPTKILQKSSQNQFKIHPKSTQN